MSWIWWSILYFLVGFLIAVGGFVYDYRKDGYITDDDSTYVTAVFIICLWIVVIPAVAIFGVIKLAMKIAERIAKRWKKWEVDE